MSEMERSGIGRAEETAVAVELQAHEEAAGEEHCRWMGTRVPPSPNGSVAGAGATC